MTASTADDAHGREPIRCVLLGLGRMGRVHVEALRLVPQIEVIAVAEPAADAAARARSLFASDVAIYSDADEALKHPDVGCCLIATPTPTHAGLARAGLQNGLHVFCEKPLTLDPAESLAVGVVADTANRILQIGFWRRFAPQWQEARRQLRAGAIGRPIWARSSQWDASVAPLSFCDPRISGGLIVDFGVHDFDLIEWLTDERIVEVNSQVLRLVEKDLATVGDVDNVVIHTKLTNETAGLIDLSRNAGYGDDVRTEVLGEDGALFVETLPYPKVTLGNAEGLRTVMELPGTDSFVAGVANELRAFADATYEVTHGENVPGAAESARALAIALAATTSATASQPVRVDSDK